MSSGSRFTSIAIMLSASCLVMPSVQAGDLFGGLKDLVEEVTETSTTESGDKASSGTSNLSLTDITAGLKEALRVGSESVVTQIGGLDGYNNDPDIHIPLPEELKIVQSTLDKFGFGSLTSDVELKINRAAEAAAPQTKQILWDAITEMSLEDAKEIYDGSDNAATQYFQRVSTDDLKQIIKPIVDQSLAEVGAIGAYDAMMGEYQNLPFVPNVKSDLSSHTVDLALQGIFHYLAIEEAAIRKDPVKQTTEILTQVFGL